MRTFRLAQAAVLTSFLSCGFSFAAESADQAMLSFRMARTSPAASDGSVDRQSVESRVRVAFNEKFASQQQGMRVELVAVDNNPTASVSVSFYDARGESPVLVGTGSFERTDGGRNLIHMTSADGTAYDIMVQYNRVRPAGQ